MDWQPGVDPRQATGCAYAHETKEPAVRPRARDPRTCAIVLQHPHTDEGRVRVKTLKEDGTRARARVEGSRPRRPNGLAWSRREGCPHTVEGGGPGIAVPKPSLWEDVDLRGPGGCRGVCGSDIAPTRLHPMCSPSSEQRQPLFSHWV